MAHILLANGERMDYSHAVQQIAFNEISAAEVSSIPALELLQLFSGFKVDADCLKGNPSDSRFGVVERNGRRIFRFRSQDYRIYFTVEEEGTIVVQRVLHADSLKDFLFRSGMGGDSEDVTLSNSRSFWQLIDDGEQAARKN